MTRAELTVYHREMEIPGTKILRSGWPDFLIVREHEIYAIEIKIPTDKLSPAQTKMHEALRRFGMRIDVDVVAHLPPGNREEETDKIDLQDRAEDVLNELFSLERKMEKTRATLNRMLAWGANVPNNHSAESR